MITLRPWAVYNEIDEYAADWIENLIALGAVAPGVVDRRSIIDIRPDDYRGFRQAHFFAGIGVWSYALRRSGVSDDTALWTGSCPCQPFSAAGQGAGMDDERHLWPHWLHLIRAARPPRIYGEQVASKDGLGWLDLVCADMEGEDYSVWAVDTCSAGSGAPHIRQRLRFCADDLRSSAGWLADGSGKRWDRIKNTTWSPGRDRLEDCLGIGWLDDAQRARLEGYSRYGNDPQRWSDQDRPDASAGGNVRLDAACVIELADAHGGNASAERQQPSGQQRQQPQDGGSPNGLADASGGHVPQSLWRAEGGDGSAAAYARTAPNRPCPTNGFWRDADWLFCRDGKWRPVESGTFPLVDGSAFRMGSGSTFEGKSRQGMLKGYGNAVDAEATIDFIEATLESDTISMVPSVRRSAFADLLD